MNSTQDTTMAVSSPSGTTATASIPGGPRGSARSGGELGFAVCHVLALDISGAIIGIPAIRAPQTRTGVASGR